MLSRIRAGLCLLTLVAALGVVPAASPAFAAPPAAASAPTRVITLITGDQFAVGTDGRSVAKLPTPGREDMHYLTRRDGDRLEVVPADAVELLSAGRLDPRLFDVTTLVEAGYDETPLIVEYSGGDATARATTSAAAARVTELAAVDGLAVRPRTGRAAEVWAALTTPAVAGARSLRPGVEKVWLDGQRELDLDESVPLIGAPEAWAAGFTGAGVPVGVIDSGVDTTHPDLAGRVEARDFTGTGLADSTGHGTHVAATIAGSGAHSGGTFKGVAPDARIYSGKVCPTRNCTESAMIEAMRWMAADLKLRVVNISIGGPDAPGSDPLEAAVDSLSREFGTLFVISAGNNGANVPISSPASAETALAVAATNKDDTIADYSSVGPRADTAVLKPDLAAPGTEITSAVPTTYDPSGYASMTGTSMAAPHVAGAAAILAQQHPDWTPEQLKTVLTASARALATETSPYHQGSGRLDVARAITQTVTSSPASVQVDDLTPEGAAAVRTVTYRNTGAADVTLALSISGRTALGRPAPTGMFRLGAKSVTVPAGGEAAVAVTVDARKATGPGAFGGALIATGGATSVRTAIGLDRQPTVRLVLNHLDRNGAATNRARVIVAGLDNRYLYRTAEMRTGTLELQLPAGRYLVSSTVMTSTATSRTVTMLTDPSLDLRADTTVAMDARLGKPVGLTSDRPGAVQNSGYLNVAARVGAGKMFTFGIGGPFSEVFNARLGTGAEDHVETRVSAGFAAAGANSPWTLNSTQVVPGIPDGWTGTVSTGGAAVVTQDMASAVAGSSATTWQVPVWPDLGMDDFAVVVDHALPGSRTDYFVSAPGVKWETRFWHNVLGMSDFPPGQPTYANSITAKPETYRAGRTYTRQWNRAVFGPAFADPLVRDGDRIIGIPNPFSDAAGRYGSAITTSTAVTLTRDGQPVTSQSYLALNAAVPDAEATYRWSVESIRKPVLGLATRSSLAWTFRSARTEAAEPLPLSVIRFRPVADNTNTVSRKDHYRVAYDVVTQPGSAAPAITDVTVEFSHNGGATWETARLTGGGVAVGDRPAGSGLVSIRGTATDSAGGKVEQTVINAFRY